MNGSRLFHHVATDVGRQRQENEDSCGDFWVGPDLLLVVADGMGGHAAGALASQTALAAIEDIARQSAVEPAERLRRAFHVAHERIVEKGSAETTGMGTTAVAAYIQADGRAYVAHIGDSRLYHFRRGALSFRTTDHTRVQGMIERGILSPEEAANHPEANVINRALGRGQGPEGRDVEPEIKPEPIVLEKGDALLLCSDGLYDDIPDAEIEQHLAGRSPSEAASALVNLANERGGHDNISVAIAYWAVERAPARSVPAQGASEPELPEAPAAAAKAESPAAQPASGPAPRIPLLAVLSIGGAGAALAVLALALFGVWPQGSGQNPNAWMKPVAKPAPSGALAKQPASTPAQARPSAADGGVPKAVAPAKQQAAPTEAAAAPSTAASGGAAPSKAAPGGAPAAPPAPSKAAPGGAAPSSTAPSGRAAAAPPVAAAKTKASTKSETKASTKSVTKTSGKPDNSTKTARPSSESKTR